MNIAFIRSTRGRILKALDEKRIIDVARVNRDLQREGGSDPAIRAQAVA